MAGVIGAGLAIYQAEMKEMRESVRENRTENTRMKRQVKTQNITIKTMQSHNAVLAHTLAELEKENIRLLAIKRERGKTLGRSNSEKALSGVGTEELPRATSCEMTGSGNFVPSDGKRKSRELRKSLTSGCFVGSLDFENSDCKFQIKNLDKTSPDCSAAANLSRTGSQNSVQSNKSTKSIRKIEKLNIGDDFQINV